MIPDRQKHLESLYKKVVKDFPEINEEEIRIKYDPLFSDLSIVHSFNMEKVIIKAGIEFFDDSREEQEASIAHELGHYIENKSKSIARLQHSMKLQKKLDKGLENSGYFGQHLKNCYTANEIAADNWAVKKGYSEGLLKFLNKESDECYEAYFYGGNIKIINFDKEHLAKRIANIEQKIKEK